MRGPFLVAVLTWSIFGCASESVTRPPPPPVDWASLEVKAAPSKPAKPTATAKERGVAESYLRALATPKLTDLGRLLADDAHVAFAGYKDVHGRDSIVNVHEALLGAFDTRSFVERRHFLTDSSQVLEWTMTAVHKASQKKVTIKGVSLLWTNDDGLVTDLHFYFDQALADAQTGVGPKSLLSLAPPLLPTAPAEEIEQSTNAAERANVAVVRSSLEAFEDRNIPAYLATLSDDVELNSLEDTKPLRGKKDARGYLEGMHKSIGHLDTSIEDIWGIGAYVVVEYDIVGEQRGPIFFVPTQPDNLVKLFVAAVVRLEAGKITNIWRYSNPAQLLLVQPHP